MTTYRWNLPLLASSVGMVAIAAACAGRAQLVPSLAGQRVTDDPNAATVEVEGVTLIARTDVWRGSPRRFHDLVPVLVTITNESSEPVRVHHEDFALVSTDGARVTATPPHMIEEVELEVVDRPIAPYAALGRGLFIYPSPFLFHGFGGLGHFGGFSPLFYGASHETPFRRIVLPTADMVAKALPERALEPGDRASGFIFFDDLDDADEGFELHADLVSAVTREPIAMVAIPFRADDEVDEIAADRRPGGIVEVGAEPAAAARQVTP